MLASRKVFLPPSLKRGKTEFFRFYQKATKAKQTASAALDKIRIHFGPILRNLIVRKKFARMGAFKRGRKNKGDILSRIQMGSILNKDIQIDV